jgi:hypothetical protein
LHSSRISHTLGVVSFLLQGGLLAGIVLVVVRRWPAFPGNFLFTPLLGLSSAGLCLMQDTFELLPGIILAGVGIDFFYRLLKPAVARPGALRLFAGAAPMTWSTFYFLGLSLSQGVWWSAPMVSGTIFLTGIVGWLMSYLMVPPAVPAEPPGGGQG